MLEEPEGNNASLKMHKIESAKNMQSPLELCFVKFNITDVCSNLFNV